MPLVKKPVAPVIHAQFFGETRAIVNGRVVKDTVINAAYDGKMLRTLLMRPTSKINLLDRLRDMYGKQTHNIGKKQHKRKQHTQKKRRT